MASYPARVHLVPSGFEIATRDHPAAIAACVRKPTMLEIVIELPTIHPERFGGDLYRELLGRFSGHARNILTILGAIAPHWPRAGPPLVVDLI